MIVCIAEKPSVAAEIAKVLGASARKDGYYEGNGYQVTWTFGHLCTLKEPDDYTPMWKRWSLAALPMIPQRFGIKLIDDKGIKKQFDTIARLYSKADEIINCGDAGQEGELIQRWVMELAHVTIPVRRLWISSLTTESIREGFSNLHPQSDYDNLYRAGLGRAWGDWLLGMNCTRLYSVRYGQPGRPLSIGRVQTPTLAMIVRRDSEIEHFHASPYWVLVTRYREVLFTSDQGKMEDSMKAQTHLASSRGALFTITDVKEKEQQELPPQLYDLTALQVDCNKKFGMSADDTLKAIQSLYEKKLTSYPRVDTRFLTHDIYGKCPEILRHLRDYGPYIATLLQKPLPKSSRVFDDAKVTDHHAIIPTGEAPSGVTAVERKVYDLIARRFISVFCTPCVYAQTTVHARAGGETFKATGKVMKFAGWRSVYGSVPSASDEGEDTATSCLPVFTPGESGPHTPSLQRKLTTPPKRYTEATLLQDMETAGKFVEDETLRERMKANGIGRPSSRAGIIETLLRRGYIVRQRKNLVSTFTGRSLVSIIKDKLLVSPEMTGLWENRLRQIETGTYTLEAFMASLTVQVRAIIAGVRSDKDVRRIAPVQKPAASKPDRKAMTMERLRLSGEQLLGKTCPSCGKGVIRKGPYSYFCTEYKNGCKFKKPL